MEWLPGETLGYFIEKNVNNSRVVKSLADSFLRLAADLQALGVAHGDLQHGNILVSNGRLTLIDYDGMFVPSLAGQMSAQGGHVNYQHPSRSARDYNSQIDRFSEICIYLGLRAIAANPGLWSIYGAGGENILFQHKDFADPERSRLFADLRAIPEMQQMASAFRCVCLGDIAAVPLLADIIDGRYQPQAAAAQHPFVAGTRPFEVMSAEDVSGLLKRVGERIEVVGQVAEFHSANTRYGQPYLFLNFGYWPDDCFTLVLWSETLNTFRRL